MYRAVLKGRGIFFTAKEVYWVILRIVEIQVVNHIRHLHRLARAQLSSPEQR